jgi:nucleoside 2-deoxyribosyltransferase
VSRTNPTVYLAGPITGLSYGGCTEWREAVSQELTSNGITCFSPLRAKQYLKDQKVISGSYLEHTLSRSKAINERDHYDCSTCDTILVNLLGAKDRISIGTVMEVAWGFAYRKPVILAMEPEGNPHQHSMLIESCSFVLPTLEEAVRTTMAILLPNPPLKQQAKDQLRPVSHYHAILVREYGETVGAAFLRKYVFGDHFISFEEAMRCLDELLPQAAAEPRLVRSNSSSEEATVSIPD